ncbi:MAG: hypothetical protein ACOC44_02700 [Promethearchaeia archaeon]
MIFTPVGILVIKWDNEIGPINEGFYPDTLKITNNLLTQVYGSHRYQSLKPGFASLSLKNNKVVSFFSGVGEDHISVENYVVALLLRRDEKPHKFREILKEIAAKVLKRIPSEDFEEILPELYDKLSKV